MSLHERSVTVALTQRQYSALRRYSEGLGTSMSDYVRTLLRSDIPAEFWDLEEPPAGQLAFDEEAWLETGKDWQVRT